jgi:hypothetical protein
VVKTVRIAACGVAAALCAGCGGGGDSSGGVLDKADEVTVREVQEQVFSQRCAVPGCHIGPTAPFGLDLSSASRSETNLVDVASAEQPAYLRVAPHDVADSYLYMKVTGDPRISGDPMPAMGPPLSSADLALIAQWIDGGAH